MNMNRKIVITRLRFQDREILLPGLLEDGRLLEVRPEPENTADPIAPVLGNIYVGRVQRVVKNIHAAFIETAPGQVCYYSLEERGTPFFIKKISSPDLVQGDELLVQVKKEGIKTKAPAVTANLNLTGRYSVVTLGDRRTGVSGKMKKALKIYYKELLEHQFQDTFPYGIIVRTNAQNATEEELLAEIRDLGKQMDDLLAHARNRTCFSCLYRMPPGYLSYLQNSYNEGLTEIVTDQPDIYESLSVYCKKYKDLEDIPLLLYQDSMYSLANLYNLNRQMERALQKTVWLKSGGYLVIEPTEALTVIDVNTGKSVLGKNARRHFMAINLEASAEIARQIRLRNISGIIIIDYIDLESDKERSQLLEELRRQVKPDPVPVQVHDITSLGLVEVTRKKVEKSLAEQLKA